MVTAPESIPGDRLLKINDRPINQLYEEVKEQMDKEFQRFIKTLEKKHGNANINIDYRILMEIVLVNSRVTK